MTLRAADIPPDRSWTALSARSAPLPAAQPADTTLQSAPELVAEASARYRISAVSRLGSQWEDGIRNALGAIEKEARRRLEELMATVECLVENGGNETAPQLRADLERVENARLAFARETRG